MELGDTSRSWQFVGREVFRSECDVEFPRPRGVGLTMRLDTARYDAIILDLDGVVTDTVSVHELAWRRLFDGVLRHRVKRADGAGRPFSHEDYLTYVDGKPRHDGARDFLASRGLKFRRGVPTDPPERETICGLAKRKDGYFVELLAARGLRVFSGAVRLVSELRRSGVQAAVVSNSRHCRMVLAAAGLSALFPVRVDGIDADRLGLPGRPDPAVFWEATRRLGIAPERAIVVEDAETGVAAASRGGFGLVIGIDREGGGEQLRTCGADVVVTSLDEIEIADARAVARSHELLKPSRRATVTNSSAEDIPTRGRIDVQ
ncbi:MAG TPA: HAD-IA family hydrolase [Nocardioidaceae bacterium]|nr:HAD-IA family hydrolase [Nocardioidaceae bacterium]